MSVLPPSQSRSGRSDQVPVVSCAGRVVRVCAPSVFGAESHEACWNFLDSVFRLDEVRAVEIDFRSGTVAIGYRGNFGPAAFLEKMAGMLRSRQAPIPRGRLQQLIQRYGGPRVKIYPEDFRESFSAVQRGRDLIAAVAGVRRLIYLPLAGISFSLAVLGVAVPGLPTVPFLLVTSYFLIRSSPRLNERLLQSRAFGPVLRDWQVHGGMRRRIKMLVLVVMAVMVVLTVFTAGLSLAMLALVSVLFAGGVLTILRTPTIEGRVLGKS